MSIRLFNPTGRKTEARVLELQGNRYYFSYETCIGFEGYSYASGDKKLHKVRLANIWGQTTGKHIRELGIDGFQVMPDPNFQEVLKTACIGDI